MKYNPFLSHRLISPLLFTCAFIAVESRLSCTGTITATFSQRTQLIETDKQVHLDPLETVGGCIISLDTKMVMGPQIK